jgi:uncharacterized protein YndB with AHSA1/START domain
MSRPDVPLRLAMDFELPGTPEQVWAAIATADGISSWFLRTEVEQRQGGAIVMYMGEDTSSPGTVTGWDPPRRFAYEEPDWAALMGHEGASVTPLATEFLVEARSGGTCVVRVVSSAFGVGAEWEREAFEDMEKGWTPFFQLLRLYLARFAGQRATRLSVGADLPGRSEAVVSAMRRALAVHDAGQPVDARGLAGNVDQIGEEHLLLRLTDPMPGYVAFFAYDKGDGTSVAQIEGYLFASDAPAYVERERPAWKAWLDGLAVPAA